MHTSRCKVCPRACFSDIHSAAGLSSACMWPMPSARGSSSTKRGTPAVDPRATGPSAPTKGAWYHLLSVPEVKTKLEHHCPFATSISYEQGTSRYTSCRSVLNMLRLCAVARLGYVSLSPPVPAAGVEKDFQAKHAHLEHCLRPCICMLLELALCPERPATGEPSIHDLRRSAIHPQHSDGTQARDPVADGGDQTVHEL